MEMILQGHLAMWNCQKNYKENLLLLLQTPNDVLKQEGKKLGTLVALMETAFFSTKDQLRAHRWHRIMAKHQGLNVSNLAGIFKKA
jgi:hypothetical protein